MPWRLRTGKIIFSDPDVLQKRARSLLGALLRICTGGKTGTAVTICVPRSRLGNIRECHEQCSQK
ncbi:hypothetical protein KL86DES1_20128 [uncultured Desulfovibrio sp.]|uniref:Uncharacterized protein n=1 Tax=uncultured Desulfovibrio sp. TaxID=167968 RepID=A0A212L297_9BACT|nr:hypothetical protein KL86DES1_20128 [uncultured Desulfovibrio sp.]VZH33027.1 conserved protein of unknown function [Desulfovibrio sp. 86]